MVLISKLFTSSSYYIASWFIW